MHYSLGNSPSSSKAFVELIGLMSEKENMKVYTWGRDDCKQYRFSFSIILLSILNLITHLTCYLGFFINLSLLNHHSFNSYCENISQDYWEDEMGHINITCAKNICFYFSERMMLMVRVSLKEMHTYINTPQFTHTYTYTQINSYLHIAYTKQM